MTNETAQVASRPLGKDKYRLPPKLKKPQIEHLLTPVLTDDHVIRKLFPQGLNPTDVWNEFIVLLTPNEPRSERLENLLEPKFHLRRRIREHFPSLIDLLKIIEIADIAAVKRITAKTWRFGRTHRGYSNKAIVLEGDTSCEVLLDWAVLAVIVMMLKRIRAPGFK